MEAFVHGNLKLDLSGVTGNVTDQQKYSETHMSSSGGGGYIHQGSGQIQATTISSHAVTKHEFWIVDDAQRHVPVQLSGVDIPLSTGQRVTLVYAKGRKDGSYLALLVNHAAQRYWRVANAEHLLYVSGNKKILHTSIGVVVALALWALIGFLFAVACFAIFLVIQYVNQAASKKALEAHLADIGKNMLSAPSYAT